MNRIKTIFAIPVAGLLLMALPVGAHVKNLDQDQNQNNAPQHNQHAAGNPYSLSVGGNSGNGLVIHHSHQQVNQWGNPTGGGGTHPGHHRLDESTNHQWSNPGGQPLQTRGSTGGAVMAMPNSSLPSTAIR